MVVCVVATLGYCECDSQLTTDVNTGMDEKLNK